MLRGRFSRFPSKIPTYINRNFFVKEVLQKGKKYKKQAVFMYLQKNAPHLTFRAFLDKEARCSRSDTTKQPPPLALNLTRKIEHFPIAVESVEFLQTPPNCFYTGRTVARGPSGTACILRRFPCRV
jgi:hypothetical protein